MGFNNDWMFALILAEIDPALRAIYLAGNYGGIIALTPNYEDGFGAWGARYFASVTTWLITQAIQKASAAGRRLHAPCKLTY